MNRKLTKKLTYITRKRITSRMLTCRTSVCTQLTANHHTLRCMEQNNFALIDGSLPLASPKSLRKGLVRHWTSLLAVLAVLLVAQPAHSQLIQTHSAMCVGETSTFTLNLDSWESLVCGFNSGYWFIDCRGCTVTNRTDTELSLLWEQVGGSVYIEFTGTCGIQRYYELSGPTTPSLTPEVSIAATSLSVCQGQAVSFTATPTHGGANPIYQWMVNGALVSGGSSATLSRTFTTPGTYTVSCTMTSNHTSGCMTTNTATSQVIVTVGGPINTDPFLPVVTIPPTTPIPPGAVITPSVVTLCGGGSVVLSATQVGGTTFQWRRDGTAIPGATAATYSTTENGSYSVIVSAAGCNLSVTSDPVLVTLTSTIASQTTGPLQGPAAVCPGNTYTYRIPPVATATRYVWTLPTGATGSSTTNSINVTFGSNPLGTISVQAFDNCNQSAPAANLAISPRPADAVTSVRLDPTQLQNRVQASLQLNTCSQVDVNVCSNRVIRKATLQAILNTGDIHTLPVTGTASTATVTLTIQGFNQAGQVVFTRPNLVLTIDQTHPEQLINLDFTAVHSSVIRFVATPSAYSGSANLPGTGLTVRYLEEFTYPTATVSNLQVSADDPADLGYERTFSWQTSCPKVGDYQLELLRLYTNARTNTLETANWSKALSIETENAVTSLPITIAEGTGWYRWRVRAIGNLTGGIANPLNWGAWQEGSNFFFTQPDETNSNGTNWIYSRTFTEGCRMSEQMSFANGLGQVAQLQTKIQSQQQVVVSETKQDYTGRDALQSLPVPVAGKSRLGYIERMLKDSQGNAYLKNHFDSDATYKNPAQAREEGYYDGSDLTDQGQLLNGGVPSAEGYPFTRTLYTTDGTNRVKEQGGVGAAHRLGTTHTVKNYYSGVADGEIVKLFGAEAPRAANMHKTITVDPNGTSSITYQTKDGKTIATAVVGGSSKAPNLDALPVPDSLFKTITETITEKTPFNGIGNSSRKPLVLTENTTRVTFTYRITPESITDFCKSYCSTCDYQVTIRVINQDSVTHIIPVGQPIMIPAGSCGSISEYSLPAVSVDLPGPATYVIEKQVTAHNRAAGSNLTYLEEQLRGLEILYSEANATGPWVQIRTYLNTGKSKELYEFLRQNNYTRVPAEGAPAGQDIPYYLVPLPLNTGANCETFNIHIPILPDPCADNVCSAIGTENTFEAYFLEKTGLDGPQQRVSQVLAAQGFADGYFDEMIARMVNDGYVCSQLWNCWRGVVDQYIDARRDHNGNPPPPATIPGLSGDNVNDLIKNNYKFNLLDNFLQCAEAEKKSFYTTQPATPDQIKNSYKTFYVNPAPAPGDGRFTNCQEQFNTDATLGSSSSADDQMRYQSRYNNFYNCLRYSAPQVSGQVAAELKAELLASVTGQITKACTERREEYRQQLINTIHTVEGKLIEGLDAHFLVEDPSVSFKPNVPLKIAAGEPLPDGYVFSASNSYQLCQVEQMADAMVAHCQTAITAELIERAGQNTPEGQAAYHKIQQTLLHGFDVLIGNSCGTGYEMIDPALFPGGGGNVPVVPFDVTQTGPAGVGNTQTNALWMDAGNLTGYANGANVPQWNDRSGNGSHAVQSASTSQPIYTLNALNGRPALRFNGSQFMDTPSGLLKNNNPVTLFVAYQWFNGGFAGFVSNRSADWDSPMLGIDSWQKSSPTIYAQAGNPIIYAIDGPALTANQPSLVSYIRGSATHALMINGNSYSSGPVGNFYSQSASTTRIGAYRSEGELTGGHMLNGDIAEIIGFNQTLTPPQRIIVDNYLAAKYSLTIANDYYTTHTPTYYLDVQGIGTVDGTAKHTQAAQGKGLILAELNNTLNTANEFVFAGHGSATNAELASNDLPQGVIKRWQRDWYIQKTGAVDVRLAFDFAAAGVTVPSDLATQAGRYRLLYRAGLTGPFQVLSANVTLHDNNRISFSLTDGQWQSGYYTLGAGSTAPPVPINNLLTALVAYWPFEETEGNLAKDATCKGYDATMYHDATRSAQGKIGQSLYVPGGDGSTVSAPLAWQPTAFTVAFWINPAALTWHVLGDPGAGFRMHSFIQGNHWLDMGPGRNKSLVTQPGVLQTNQWQHFTFTFANGMGKLYKNGQLIATETGMIPEAWSSFRFSSRGLNPGNGSFSLNGQLDEVQVYNRALTDAEVAYVANLTTHLKSPNCITCRPAPKICFKYNDTPVYQTSIQPAEGLDTAYVLKYQPPTCEQQRTQLIAASVRSQWSTFVQQRLEAYRNQYQSVCVAQEGLVEDFSFSYKLGYHHYTLYYYDRAGNLTATVPPEGVDKAFLDNGTRTGMPNHRLKTTYHYNSLGQLVRQNTPDGGTTEFYYNNKGQLRYSQDARQKIQGFYSYTQYDNLGRVVEVGESNQSPEQLAARTEEMAFPATGRRQRTTTTYSQPAGVVYAPTGTSASGSAQRYLQNRVSYVTIDEDGSDATTADRHQTFYSYDPHGNVEWLVQQMPVLGRKYVRYEYDLISGKVLRINYQENTAEQFYHRYAYDEDNRLTGVETSADGVLWERDAQYNYYRHGPLLRTELGEDRIQGIDYTYTIQGWLKAVNGTASGGGGNAVVPASVFRMALGYYAGDYKRNGSRGLDPALRLEPTAERSLYNGNIATWSKQTAPAGSGLAYNGQVTAEQYSYDELNRITTSSFSTLSGAAAAQGAFATSYGYDANGNLLSLTRKDRNGGLIDNLAYSYNRNTTGELTNNKLRRVADPAGNVTGTDVANQPEADNYVYDQIGNLIEDKQDNIQIEWTVYGKVKSVVKTDGSRRIDYLYDASGNRTVKRVQTSNPATTVSTYYVRDAQGNVLAVYDDDNTNSTLAQREVYLYGSSRLGLFRPATRSLVSNGIYTRSLTQKEYELTDHLGNVRAVVGDYREGGTGANDPVRAALRSYSNYYAFGMEMPGMNYKGANGYRYGFNGKEKDNEGMGGGGSTYDYGFRIYNPSIAKFLSVDPLTMEYPWYTPYQFAGNKPIWAIDLDGLEEWLTNSGERETGPYSNEEAERRGLTYLGQEVVIHGSNNSSNSTATNRTANGILTYSQMRTIFPAGKKEVLETIVDRINSNGATYGIKSPEGIAHFLSQTGVETGGFKKFSVTENLNYSAAGLSKTWPGRFYPNTNRLPSDYAHNKIKIANLVYGRPDLGNGDEASGDGWKYRGRGIIQLTGKANYTKFSSFYQTHYDPSVDFVTNPNMIADNIDISILSGMWYFRSRVLRAGDINRLSVKKVTQLVNGGEHGIIQRDALYHRVLNTIKNQNMSLEQLNR